jgi:hypothetical protein
MAFFKNQNTTVERAAMTLAAAGGAAHVAFFTLFGWRIIGRDGFGTVGYALLALVALVGIGLNFLGYWLIRRGHKSSLRKWGFMAVALSTGLAGALLAVASWTA